MSPLGGALTIDQRSLARAATHDDGTKSNTLKVPATGHSAGQLLPPLEATERQRHSPHPGLQGTIEGASPSPAKPRPSHALYLESTVKREASGTPVEVTAQTAAEVADTAAMLERLP